MRRDWVVGCGPFLNTWSKDDVVKGRRRKNDYLVISLGIILDPIYKGTSFRLGSELRYVFWKVLGTQHHSSLWIFFIHIIGYSQMVFIK